jgi:hypothetical protein
VRNRTESEHSLNYGYFFLESVYRKLGLHSFLKKANNGKAAYDLESIVELLVFSRLLAPSSKSATFENKGNYFRSFDLEFHDIYRALDGLDTLADDIQLHIHKQITSHYGRDASLVFYDVTNYYFECDFEDAFRKKGASKEHRRDPIVQMGLLVDSAGIPIAYRLFEGNTHDAKTLIPVLKELKVKYGFSRIVVVADKGLNGKDNLGFTVTIYVGGGKMYMPVSTGGKLVAMEYKGNFFEDGKSVLTQAFVQVSDETRTRFGIGSDAHLIALPANDQVVASVAVEVERDSFGAVVHFDYVAFRIFQVRG